MNNLISSPEYNEDYIKIFTDIKVKVNGVHRGTYQQPFFFTRRDLKHKFNVFYSQFIFDNESLDILKKLGNDNYLKLHKYVTQKEKYLRITIKKTNTINGKVKTSKDIYNLTIRYTEVREQVISYIEQSIGKTKKLEIVKKLFVSDKNCETYEDYLKQKSKQLLSLDLDNTFGLTEQMQKRKEELLKQYEV